MANEKHAVLNTDKLAGTQVHTALVSAKYFVGTTETDIDNGNIIDISNGLIAGERELYKATAPLLTSDFNTLAIVGTPEVCYDERKRNLEDYYNEAGKAIRAYRLCQKDIFSVTKEAFSGDATPTVGDTVGYGGTTKITLNGGTKFGSIIDVVVQSSRTLYTIEVMYVPVVVNNDDSDDEEEK